MRLAASVLTGGDQFGAAVFVSGVVAVIGAPRHGVLDERTGAAFVYRREGSVWIEEQKLTAIDSANLDLFGTAVTTERDVLIVGAPLADDQGANSGSAYVYRWDGTVWSQEQELIAFDGVEQDLFGFSVAMSADTAIVGAPFNDALAYDAGAAYVYRRVGGEWINEQKLVPSVTAVGDHFGISIAISDGVAVVGASQGSESDHFAGPGAAYVYRFDGKTWIEEARLALRDGVDGDHFGIAVGLGKDVAVIGASQGTQYNHPDSGTGAGYVFRFDGTTWVEVATLRAADAVPNDWFGSSVAFSANLALIGAPRNDLTGAAYIFNLCRGDTDGSGVVDVDDLINVILDWETNGSRHGGDADGDGSVNESDLDAVFAAWGECPST
jgi:hypothetical protein